MKPLNKILVKATCLSLTLLIFPVGVLAHTLSATTFAPTAPGVTFTADSSQTVLIIYNLSLNLYQSQYDCGARVPNEPWLMISNEGWCAVTAPVDSLTFFPAGNYSFLEPNEVNGDSVDCRVLSYEQCKDMDPLAHEIFFTVALEPVQVTIDIKPGSFPNSINLGSRGVVAVAIFSTPEFDATTIDPAMVTLANALVALKGKGVPMASVADVNDDGLSDLVVHIDTETLELSAGDTDAVLKAKTFGGLLVAGMDLVRLTP